MHTEREVGGGHPGIFSPDQSLSPPLSKFPLKLNHNRVLQPIEIRKKDECSQLFKQSLKLNTVIFSLKLLPN